MPDGSEDTGATKVIAPVPACFRAAEISAFWHFIADLAVTAVPPRFADFELMDIYRLARNIVILDTNRSDTDRLYVRYAGIHVVEMFGRETTGLYMDEIDLGKHRDALLAIYQDCAVNCTPYWTLANVHISVPQSFGPPKEHLFDYERLVFPFAGKDGNVSNLVSILIRHPSANLGQGFEAIPLDFPTSTA